MVILIKHFEVCIYMSTKNVNDLFSLETVEYTDPYEEEYIDDNEELKNITEEDKDKFNAYIVNLFEEKETNKKEKIPNKKIII